MTIIRYFPQVRESGGGGPVQAEPDWLCGPQLGPRMSLQLAGEQLVQAGLRQGQLCSSGPSASSRDPWASLGTSV